MDKLRVKLNTNDSIDNGYPVYWMEKQKTFFGIPYWSKIRSNDNSEFDVFYTPYCVESYLKYHYDSVNKPYVLLAISNTLQLKIKKINEKLFIILGKKLQFGWSSWKIIQDNFFGKMIVCEFDTGEKAQQWINTRFNCFSY